MAVFIRRRRRSGLHRHHLRYFPRQIFHGRLLYRWNRHSEQRRMFERYIQVDRLEQLIKTAGTFICLLAVSTFILNFQTPGVRFSSSFPNLLLRCLIWFFVLCIGKLLIVICFLIFFGDIIRRNIAQRWNRMNRRLNSIYISRSVYDRRRRRQSSESTLTQEGSNFTSNTKVSQLEEFLNIIAKDFSEDDTSSSLGGHSEANLRHKTAFATTVDNSNQSSAVQNQCKTNLCLYESGNSVPERDINDISNCPLSFVDFMKMLNKVNSQDSRQMCSSSLNEIVLKYKEELLEKVKLSVDYQQVTCVKHFYNFIQSSWDEWFPQTCGSTSSNVTSEELSDSRCEP